MQIHRYDGITMEYVDTVGARIDPLETERSGSPVYLLPANATHEPPPAITVGCKEVAVWQGEAWQIVPDHRGERYWDKTGEHAIAEIGKTIPAGAATGPRPSAQHLLVDGAWVLDLPSAKEAACKRLQADLHKYILVTRDYPSETQGTLQAIYADPISSQAQKDACLAVFHWIRLIALPYYYGKKTEILESDDPGSIQWNFEENCDAAAPGHTLRQIIERAG